MYAYIYAKYMFTATYTYTHIHIVDTGGGGGGGSDYSFNSACLGVCESQFDFHGIPGISGDFQGFPGEWSFLFFLVFF